jgi:hypothetical protein
MTKRQIQKIERAIDKLIDLQDEGLGNQEIAICLDMLNSLRRGG